MISAEHRRLWSTIIESHARTLAVPADFRAVTFIDLADELGPEAPNLAAGLIDAVSKAALLDEDAAVRMVAALEAHGLIAFAISPRRQPAVFIAPTDRFVGGTDYMAARGLVEFFDSQGEYDEQTTNMIRDGVSVGEWESNSSDVLREIAEESRLSKRVVLATLLNFEREGWTNIRTAPKSDDGGYYVQITIPDAKQLSYTERAVIAALTKKFGQVKGGKALDTLMTPASKQYAQAEYMRAVEYHFSAVRMAQLILAKARTVDAADMVYIGPSTEVSLNALREADTYCWFPDPEIAVQASAASLPSSVVASRDMTDGVAGFWYFTDPIGVQTVIENVPIDAVLWKWAMMPHRTEFGIVERYGLLFEAYIFDDKLQAPIGTTRFFWREGTSIDRMLSEQRSEFLIRYKDDPESLARIDVHQTASEYMARFFAAGALWLRQRIIVESRQPVERHFRKRTNAELKLTEKPISDVRVIQLRRRQSVSEASPGSGKHVDWKFRWNVVGHWRNQPYKSTGKIETIWIDSYLKGPDDRPVKGASGQRPKPIYAVKR